MRSAPALRLLPLLVLAACTDPVDKAAKERIFSPEDPPKAVASAAEKLAAGALDSDPKAARRVLTMGAAEVTERLGPHRFDATVQFTWKGKERTVELSERRTLLAGRGGVSGDFHASVENSRDQGLEVMRADGKVYARSRYQKFRQRTRDRGMAERTREEVAGVLRDVDTLFNRRVRLESRGSADHEGRAAHRYALTLGPESLSEAGRPLPPPPVAKEGTDPSTQRRLAFLQQREPVQLDGMIVVDDETGVVLWGKVDGRLRVPDTESAPGAELRLRSDFALTNIGEAPAIVAPKDALPDADKPQGIADALDAFGIPHGGAQKPDAGTAAPPEPEDEEGA